MHALHNTRETTAKARAAAASRFEAHIRELFPDIDDAEVARRTAALRRAHFARMALASVKARAKKRAAA